MRVDLGAAIAAVGNDLVSATMFDRNPENMFELDLIAFVDWHRASRAWAS